MNNFFFMATLCGLFLMRCGIEPLAGGSTDTELGAVVTGKVYDDQGSPALHTRVDLIPRSYNPVIDAPLPDHCIDSTDSLGRYTFKNIAKGGYSVFASHSFLKRNLLITGIEIGEDDTVVKVRWDTLRKTGSIAIELSDTPSAQNGYVYIPGTPIFTHITQHAVLDGIPVGSISSVCYTDKTDTAKAFIVRSDVPVVAEDTTTIVDYHLWRYSKAIVLNTSATGAGIVSAVTGFPVLIRLTNDNFSFSQAQGLGADLRFTKPDGAFLPYEIERWDSAGGHAEIWVTVDTIHGDNGTQFVTMLWGNPLAIDNSGGAETFDTADGFEAVWHLDRTCDDASLSKHSGVNFGTADTIGIIGLCKKFNGSDSIKIAGLLGQPSSFTLSAWAQLDTSAGGNGGEILSIGDVALIRMDYPVLGAMGATHPYAFTGDSGFYNVSSGLFLKRSGWHFIALTVDPVNNSQALFIDGACVRLGTGLTSAIDYSGLGRNTYIGKHGNGKTGYNFTGRIDEVRVYKTALSPDYIKLCYLNQKAVDALLVFP